MRRRFLVRLAIGIALIVLLQQCLAYSDLNILTLVQGHTNFSRTKILFSYPDNPATIWDPHNKLYQIYGNYPDSITITNRTRLVIFTKPAILKSNADSIEIGRNYAKYAGYLGITTDSRKFVITPEGDVEEIRLPQYPEPDF